MGRSAVSSRPCPPETMPTPPRMTETFHTTENLATNGQRRSPHKWNTRDIAEGGAESEGYLDIA